MNIATIPPLSVYENLHIPVKNSIEIPFSYKGEAGTACEKIVHTGSFNIIEQNYTSLFISSNGLLSFEDDNDKALNGVNIRLDN